MAVKFSRTELFSSLVLLCQIVCINFPSVRALLSCFVSLQYVPMFKEHTMSLFVNLERSDLFVTVFFYVDAVLLYLALCVLLVRPRVALLS